MRGLGLILKLLALLLALVLSLTGALWWWIGINTSLPTTLSWIQTHLPGDQSLEFKDGSGALRSGGHIGWLRWRRAELSVELQDLSLAWDLSALTHGQLKLSQLAAKNVKVDDQRPRSAAAPVPLQSLHLPLQIDSPFQVDHFSLTGASHLELSGLRGHYVFDGISHRLSQGALSLSSGSYELSGSLQAAAPMALDLQLSGQVSTPVPSRTQALKVAAKAHLSGTLASSDARLALEASLTPDLPASSQGQRSTTPAMQAQLSAQIAPWQSQALVQAQGQWQALDLAALWPQAPRTGLSGQAKVTPKGSEWLAQITLSNSLPGPWNLQQLPLSTLQADINYHQGGWTIQALSASSAAGTVKGGGSVNSGLWQGKFELNNIDPSLLDSRLASNSLSGQIAAQQGAQGIGFDVKLQANSAPQRSSPSNALQTLELQSLQAQGLWQKPLLTLQQLQINAVDAQLQGKLSYQLDSQAASATLALTLPGMQAQLDGQIARSSGQGMLALDISKLQQASQWWSRWPVVAKAVQTYQLDGMGQLQASWHGGWQDQGRALQVEAKLRVPQLGWQARNSSTQAAQIKQLQADLSGSLAALQLSTQGELEMGTRQSHWQAQANAAQVNSGQWRGRLDSLSLHSEDSRRPGLWKLQLAKAGIPWEWQSNDNTRSANLGAGTAQLSGPQQGAVQLNWQPLSWSQANPVGGPTAKAQWQSQGQISGLPLSWLDAVSKKTMNDLGLSSDMLLAGQWQASQGESLHASLNLERSSGDLRLRTDDSRQLLPAGMKDARLDINLDGDYLSSSLRWDSQRAGQALVAFSTQLSPAPQGWTLQGNAPVGGGIQLQMPPVDAWSVLAPPGWRLRGTMNADVALTGTLDLPQWSGKLQARDLAVRSVVDGVDFSQGTLSVRMHEQQLDIEKFSLQGASSGASDGGQLELSGSVFWLPNQNPSKPLSQVRVALSLEAKALRLNNRSDRRVVMSGKVSANLQDNKLTLRGGLVADQARITLPDDSAPQLSDDVIVHRADSPADPAAKTQAKTSDKRLSVTPDLHIEFDLGTDFQVRGRGLDTRLSGKLQLQTIDGNPPTLVGTVNTVRGTFQAYGQKLNIEQGELRFVGPPNNPVLNILAIRPNLSQRVGAQVLGTALSPVVRLYSEPDLPEAEKLAWLVLGRSTSGSGGEAALLQQAALALLGGGGRGPSTSLTQSLGLDELSFRSASGTTSSATLTIGKRLSQDFYVAYESGLAGAMGMFTIFYELSKRLTVRAQTGQQTAIDLIWTHQYD